MVFCLAAAGALIFVVGVIRASVSRSRRYLFFFFRVCVFSGSPCSIFLSRFAFRCFALRVVAYLVRTTDFVGVFVFPLFSFSALRARVYHPPVHLTSSYIYVLYYFFGRWLRVGVCALACACGCLFSSCPVSCC